MTDAPDHDADRYAYSRTAPARLALSAEPRELADREGRAEAAQQADEPRALAVQIRVEAGESGEGTS
ncbi:hypothetical protein HUT15_34750 [Streptomyces sp. NA03103]|uniref:hypothetical protein n=1 Tax=unclassified Streptomyces TaxID=2593676 RepID=UPI001591E38A|nr:MULTISPECIES: hypothetical protein [unclassified Streptomyces]MBH5130621.1 hypothetical protein [Streptomyces sp. HB-N217]QKW65308.1 hypothetical protein HUT15_34750 [Streptomyces sp. NA03103]